MLVSPAPLCPGTLVEAFGVDTEAAPCSAPLCADLSDEFDEPVGVASCIVGGDAGWSAAKLSGGTCSTAEDGTCCGSKSSPASATSVSPSTVTSDCVHAAAPFCPSSSPGALETPKTSITNKLASFPAVVAATSTPTGSLASSTSSPSSCDTAESVGVLSAAVAAELDSVSKCNGALS